MRPSCTVVCGLVLSCAAHDDSCTVTTARSALTNGTSAADYLKLEPRETAAIAEVTLELDGLGEETCSGVLVTEKMVLTAKHCAHGLDPSSVRVTLGTSASGVALEANGTIAAIHPDLDVMALSLDQTVGNADEVTPIRVASALPSAFGPGSLVQLGGFGADSEGTTGERRFLVGEVSTVDSTEIVVSANGLGGACFGDSGGPALARGDDGSVRVLGVLASGTASCFGHDRYARVDALSDWLLQTTGIDASQASPDGPHVALGRAGRCFGNTAVWFGQAGLEAAPCSDREPCGWSTGEQGYRCVVGATDPCAGVSDVGACEGGIALRCSAGRLDRNPCSACGFECQRSPQTGSPVCLAPE